MTCPKVLWTWKPVEKVKAPTELTGLQILRDPTLVSEDSRR